MAVAPNAYDIMDEMGGILEHYAIVRFRSVNVSENIFYRFYPTVSSKISRSNIYLTNARSREAAIQNSIDANWLKPSLRVSPVFVEERDGILQKIPLSDELLYKLANGNTAHTAQEILYSIHRITPLGDNTNPKSKLHILGWGGVVEPILLFPKVICCYAESYVSFMGEISETIDPVLRNIIDSIGGMTYPSDIIVYENDPLVHSTYDMYEPIPIVCVSRPKSPSCESIDYTDPPRMITPGPARLIEKTFDIV